MRRPPLRQQEAPGPGAAPGVGRLRPGPGGGGPSGAGPGTRSSLAVAGLDGNGAAGPCLAARQREAPSPPAWQARDLVALAAVVASGVVLPGVLAAATRSFALPRNDDWSYLKTLSGLARAGRYSLDGWGSMTLVGQVLWAAPFALVLGAGAGPAGISVAVLAAAGLGAAYVVARNWLPPGAALLVVLGVLALPGFALNTSTFMTDVPGFSADAVCLALGTVALRRPGRWPWVAASMAAGLFGFSIREFDVTAPLAVLLALGAADRRRRRGYLLAGAGLGGACAAVYFWTASLSGAQPKALDLPGATSWRLLGGAFFTFAFMVMPWAPGALRRTWAQGGWAGPAGALAAAGAGAALLVAHQPLLFGNYLTQTGLSDGQVLFGARPDLFPSGLWWCLQGAALGAGTALAFVLGATVRHYRGRSRAHPAPAAARPGLLGAFTWSSAACLAGYTLFVRAAVWDRYLWPVAFSAAVMLALAGRAVPAPGPAPRHRARPRARRPWPDRVARTVPPVLAAVVVGVTGALTLNADAYDAARWAAGQDAVGFGFRPATVDAGFEWVGSHAPGRARPSAPAPAAPPYETWYDKMFPGFVDCAFVSGSPVTVPVVSLLGVVHYEELAFAGPEKLYLYAVRSPACPAPRR